MCGECMHAMCTGSEGRAHKHTILTTVAHLFVPHMCRVVRICKNGVSNVCQKLARVGFFGGQRIRAGDLRSDAAHVLEYIKHKS